MEKLLNFCWVHKMVLNNRRRLIRANRLGILLITKFCSTMWQLLKIAQSYQTRKERCLKRKGCEKLMGFQKLKAKLQMRCSRQRVISTRDKQILCCPCRSITFWIGKIKLSPFLKTLKSYNQWKSSWDRCCRMTFLVTKINTALPRQWANLQSILPTKWKEFQMMSPFLIALNLLTILEKFA